MDLPIEPLVALALTAPEPAARRTAALAVRHQAEVDWPVPSMVAAMAADGVGAAATGRPALHAALLTDLRGLPPGTTVAGMTEGLAPLLEGAAEPMGAAIVIAAMNAMASGQEAFAVPAVAALLARAAGPAHGDLALNARALRCLVSSPWADDATREAGTAALTAALRDADAAAWRLPLGNRLDGWRHNIGLLAPSRGHNGVGVAVAMARHGAHFDGGADSSTAAVLRALADREIPLSSAAHAAARSALETLARDPSAAPAAG